MPAQAFQNLYQEELSRLNQMEMQSLEVLPGLWRSASSPELASAFRDEYEKARYHLDQLGRLLNSHEPKGCVAESVRGLFEDCRTASNTSISVRDVALIAAAQHLEHDEIAGYGCAKSWASVLGETDAASMLNSCLEDKKNADARLSRIASRINRRAATEIATA